MPGKRLRGFRCGFRIDIDMLASLEIDRVAKIQPKVFNKSNVLALCSVGDRRNRQGRLRLNLTNVDRRSNERLQISVPVRVLSFDLEHFETGGFSEDTCTLFVCRGGASIALQNSVIAGDSLRIINLTNRSEADFRVVGGLGATDDGTDLWAVECLERRGDFWGVEFPSPSTEISDGVFLECRACRKTAIRSLTLMELEVLGSSGIIILNCDRCGKPTYWVDANPNRSVSNFPAVEAVAPPPRVPDAERTAESERNVEKRAVKRSGLKLQICVRNQAGEQEVSKIVDISKLGVRVDLFMNLDVGDTVKIICPYDPRSGGIEQSATVQWRSRYYNTDFPRTYGLRFVR